MQAKKLGVCVGLDMYFSFVKQRFYVSKHCSDLCFGSLALLENM